jgi:hypothetical protein
MVRRTSAQHHQFQCQKHARVMTIVICQRKWRAPNIPAARRRTRIGGAEHRTVMPIPNGGRLSRSKSGANVGTRPVVSDEEPATGTREGCADLAQTWFLCSADRSLTDAQRSRLCPSERTRLVELRSLGSTGSSAEGALGDGPEPDEHADFGSAVIPAGGRPARKASSLRTEDHSALKDPAVPRGLLPRAGSLVFLWPVEGGPGFPWGSLSVPLGTPRSKRGSHLIRWGPLACGNTGRDLNLRPLRPERGTTVRCRAAEHGRRRSEHDSGASGSSSAVRWARVCSFSVPWLHVRLGFTDVRRTTDVSGNHLQAGLAETTSGGNARGQNLHARQPIC